MRRRIPKTIHLKSSDAQEIKRLLSDGRTEQCIVRRGRVLLAMQKSKTVVSDLCQQVDMTRFGIWSLCRRYESTASRLPFRINVLIFLAVTLQISATCGTVKYFPFGIAVW